MNDITVLIVEDDNSLREALCDTLTLAGFKVAAAADGQAALESLTQNPHIGLVVSDVQMQPMCGNVLLSRIKETQPDLPVVLMTAYGTIQKAVGAMHEGATDYLVKPFEANVLVEMVNRFVVPVCADEDLVAEDPASLSLLDIARRVAGTDATVLISGESGTGKEVFARVIHRSSSRNKAPFVAINCAAIPENMLEAVLFGYEKGAFTGAYTSHPGKFEQAQGGTLLLDEISEMNLGLQAKLLRVLQEREVERLGGCKTIPLDVRVLATTNRQLRERVAEALFREDLYYRLNVFPIELLPLRQRPGDILPLARHILKRYCEGTRPVPYISETAQTALCTHSWLGNVRELDNLLQRALILMTTDTLENKDLRFEAVSEPVAPMPSRNDSGSCLEDDLKFRERNLIIDALKSGNGSRKMAASKLGISPRTLRYKIARLREAGIDIPPAFGVEVA